LELIDEGNGMLVKSIKPNFQTIGPKYGKQMKAIAGIVNGFNQEDITQIEVNNGWKGTIEGHEIELDLSDFTIVAQDIPGWLVASESGLTVALDITLSEELKNEGIARELINRVQNLRKDSGLEVTDKITLSIETEAPLQAAIEANHAYIATEVLALKIEFTPLNNDPTLVGLVEEEDTKITLNKA